MEAPNTRPWERDYTITQTLVLAETPELRIIDLTLAPGECVTCLAPSARACRPPCRAA